MKRKQIEYDFTKPITLIQFKSPGIDIMIYSFILGILALALFMLLFIHDGKFAIEFTLPRTLIAFPLVIISVFMKDLLNELRVYPKLLLKKKTWTLKEFMELTHKNEKETISIITRVLEASFIVDIKNIKQ